MSEISREAALAANIILQYCGNIRYNGGYPDPDAETIIQLACDRHTARVTAEKDAEITRLREFIASELEGSRHRDDILGNGGSALSRRLNNALNPAQ